jgi:hypothetical protein
VTTSSGTLAASNPLNTQSTLDFNNLLLGGSGNASTTTNNNGVIGFRLTPLTVISNNTATNAPQQSTTTNKPPAIVSASGKLVQSLAQKYSIECKAKFDELAKLVIKLNLCRKELREYDKQFKSPLDVLSRSVVQSRKNSIAIMSSEQQSILSKHTASSLVTLKKAKSNGSNCYGCQMAAVEYCITLFRALLCHQAPASNSNSVISMIKSELCRQGVLEDLVNFSLKHQRILPPFTVTVTSTTVPAATGSTNPTGTATAAPAQGSTNAQPASGAATAPTPATNTTTTTTSTSIATGSTNTNSMTHVRLYDRDLVNIIYMLVRDNAEGTQRFERLLLDKLELFLSSQEVTSGGGLGLNPLQNELILLGSLIMKPQQEDTCWEQRLRLVIHILLRSLNAAQPTSSKSKQGVSNATNIFLEYLTLPCLRMLNHIVKTTTNIGLLAQLATSSTLRQINTRASNLRQSQQQQQQQQQQGGLNRFYFSEPADAGSFSAASLPTNGGSGSVPKLAELDLNQFLRGNPNTANNNESYYTDKWLNMVNNNRTKGGNSSQLHHSASFDDPATVGPIKSKYFAAWRKYTYKKKKQRLLKSATNASLAPQESVSMSSLPVETEAAVVQAHQERSKSELPSSTAAVSCGNNLNLLSSQSSSSSGSNSNLNVITNQTSSASQVNNEVS